MQTLERPDQAVEATDREICRDTRHKGLILLLTEQINQRWFPDWSMGFHDASSEPLDLIEGYTDFFQRGRHLAPRHGTSEAPCEVPREVPIEVHGEVPGGVPPAVLLLRTFRETMR